MATDVALPHQPRQILVVLDSSGRSETILLRMRSIARNSGATLHLLVAYPPVQTVLVQGLTAADSAHMEARVLQKMLHYLEHLALQLRRAGMQATAQLRFGEPVPTILAAAEACRADLIGMTIPWIAGDGLQGPENVTEQVIRQAPVPVLIARLDTQGLKRSRLLSCPSQL